MRTRPSRHLFAALVLCGWPLGDIHRGPPPPGARLEACPSWIQSGAFRGSVRVETAEKQVHISWTKSAPKGSDAADLVCDQSIAVAFWPNAAEVVGERQLLVAGKDLDGDTRIERWDLALPAVSPTVLGEELTPRDPAKVETVYEASTAGKDMVRFLLKNQGKPGRVFVQFYDSKSLYELDYAREPYAQRLLLDRTSEPNLQQAYAECFRGDHATHGYVYVFASSSSFGRTVPALVLRDTDRDGALDVHGALTWAAYAEAGLASKENWVSLRGL